MTARSVKEVRKESSAQSAQARHFPHRKLKRLLEVVGGLMNCQSFDAAVGLLEELFIDILRYEGERRSIAERTALPPSARAGEELMIASLGGVRICIIERHHTSFRSNAYDKVFRLHPETILFVYSSIDGRIRVVFKRKPGGKRRHYRSITPRNILGPRSDSLASWALRLGLLNPALEVPGHINYELFRRLLYCSLPELLAEVDPYQWENRADWTGPLSITDWERHLLEPVERFLQIRDRILPPRAERLAKGLEEALIRSFPIYVQGKEKGDRQRLTYRDYRLERGGDGRERVVLELLLSVEDGAAQRVENFEIVWELPHFDENGHLLWRGERWRFRATAGLDLEWVKTGAGLVDEEEDESEEEEERLNELILEELGDELEESLEDASKESADQDEDEWLLYEESHRDQSHMARELRFLSLDRAFGYGVTTSLKSLRWWLRNYWRAQDRSLSEHIQAVINQWRVDQNRQQPRSILPAWFVERFFEPLSSEGLLSSREGARFYARAVEIADGKARQWACPVARGVLATAAMPVAGAVAHPIYREFLYDPHGQGRCVEALSPRGFGKGEAAQIELRALLSADRRRATRALLVAGDHREVVVREGSLLHVKPVEERLLLSRRLGPAQPVICAPTKIFVHNTEPPYELASDPSLDEETGFIRAGELLKPGEPLAARVLQRCQREVLGEEIFLDAVLWSERSKQAKAPLTGYRDASWYSSQSSTALVQAVEFEGNSSSEGGELRVHLSRRRRCEPGAYLASSDGFGGVVSELKAEEEMPFDVGGNPVDAVISVPEGESRWWAQVMGEATVFDENGAPIEGAVLIEGGVFSLIRPANLQAQAVYERTNIWGRPILERPQEGINLLPIFAQLRALGATQAMRALLENSQGDGELEVHQRRTLWRLDQLLDGLGLVLTKADDEQHILLELKRPGNDGRELLSNPAATVNFRTGRAERGGLFDPLKYSPLPAEIVQVGGLYFAKTDSGSLDAWKRALEKTYRTQAKTALPKRIGAVRALKTPAVVIGNSGFVLPEPVINPLAEPAIARFFGISHQELTRVIAGSARLRRGTPLEEDRWVFEPVSTPNKLVAEHADISGAPLIEALLREEVSSDPAAPQLLQGVWRILPVLAPHWRPIVEGQQDDESWLVGDLNRIYVRIAHVAERVKRIRAAGYDSPFIFLEFARIRLREELYHLMGLPDPTSLNEQSFGTSAVDENQGVLACARKFLERQTFSTASLPLPHSIISDWAPSTSEAVEVPIRSFLQSWLHEISQRYAEERQGHLFSNPMVLQRAIEESAPEIMEFMLQELNGAPLGGYLITAQSALIAVQIKVSAHQEIVRVPKIIIDQLQLSATEPLRLFIPPDREAQDEAALLARSPDASPRYGSDPDLVTQVMKRWGHIEVNEQTTNSGATSAHGERALSPGENGGAWFVRELSRLPLPVQRAYLEKFGGQWRVRTRDLESFCADHQMAEEWRPVLERLLEFQRRYQSTIAPAALWQLADPQTLTWAVVEELKVGHQDFLSRLIQAKPGEEELSGAEPGEQLGHTEVPSITEQKASPKEVVSSRQGEDEEAEQLAPPNLIHEDGEVEAPVPQKMAHKSDEEFLVGSIRQVFAEFLGAERGGAPSALFFDPIYDE